MNKLAFTILFTIFIAFIITFFGLLIYVVRKKDELNEKYGNADMICGWEALFAGWLIGPQNLSFGQNINKCISNEANNAFTRFFVKAISPFTKMFDIVGSILKQLVQNIQNIREIIYHLRNTIFKWGNDICKKLKNIYKKLSKLYRALTKFVFDIYKVFNHLFNSLKYTVKALKNIKKTLGKVDICFDGYTPVLMSDNSIKYIKDIKLGELLVNNNKVVGVMKIDAVDVEMYNYEGIIVSGSHLVYEKKAKKWIRVKECPQAQPVINYNSKYIYNLITNNATVQTPNIKFADYYEINNIEPFINIQTIIRQKLNNIQPNISTFNPFNICTDWWGFDGDTSINMYNNKNKKISELRIGDKLQNGSHVSSLVKLIVNGNSLYRYQFPGTNAVICSGTQLVYENKKWIAVCDSKHSLRLYFGHIHIIYQIITDDNNSSAISIYDNIFSDFDQIRDSKLNDKINIYVEACLNNQKIKK